MFLKVQWCAINKRHFVDELGVMNGTMSKGQTGYWWRSDCSRQEIPPQHELYHLRCLSSLSLNLTGTPYSVTNPTFNTTYWNYHPVDVTGPLGLICQFIILSKAWTSQNVARRDFFPRDLSTKEFISVALSGKHMNPTGESGKVVALIPAITLRHQKGQNLILKAIFKFSLQNDM